MEASLSTPEVWSHIDDNYVVLTIPKVAQAQLLPDRDNPDTLDLLSISVEQEYRGIGLGRVLFDKSVEYAEDHDFTYLGASVANERTGSLFANTFGPENLNFFTYIRGRSEYRKQNWTYEECKQRMNSMRSSMSNKEEGIMLPSAVAYFLAPLACARIATVV